MNVKRKIPLLCTVSDEGEAISSIQGNFEDVAFVWLYKNKS